ncbi:hypothetical protein BDQ17DRAFT_1540798 [Cyathus striatus]|nr:hypothetical protein BDQ17DRAFT_1540798 [Cyathus striatus]
MAFPPEICSLICRDEVLTRADLCSLAAVSRAFRVEAERLLYMGVILSELKHIKTWCRTLKRRPYLSLRTYVLSITMPPQADLQSDDLTMLINALKVCSKLKDLRILKDNSMSSSGDAINGWILEGHPFKLMRFTNTYFRPHVLRNFFLQQPDIRFLDFHTKATFHCQYTCCLDLPPEGLPLLRTLKTHSCILQSFQHSWWPANLHHLHYDLHQSSEDEELLGIVALIRIADTLKSLSIRRTCTKGGIDISVMAECIASQIPNLKYLRIIDSSVGSGNVPNVLFPFPSTRFKCLETLVISPLNKNTYPDLKRHTTRVETAKRIMETYTTLKRFLIITSRVYEFRRVPVTNNIVESDPPGYDANEWMKVQ